MPRWEVLPNGTIVNAQGCAWAWIEGTWDVECSEDTHFADGCPQPPAALLREARVLAQGEG